MTRRTYLAALAMLGTLTSALPAQFLTPPLAVDKQIAATTLPALEMPSSAPAPVPAPVPAPAPASKEAATPDCPACATTPETKFRKWTLGHLFRSMLAPVRILTGRIIPHCCLDAAPLPPEETPLPVLAAAKIQADQARTGMRLNAVRYLGTVDCHYYPEAEEALIAALRGDRSESVRLEAALSLGTGGCCSVKTIEKLQLVVSGGDADGNPSENSPRVKAAAVAALQKCLGRQNLAMARPEPPRSAPPHKTVKEAPTPAKKSGLKLAAVTPPVVDAPNRDQVLSQARRTMLENVGAPSLTPKAPRSLLDVILNIGSPADELIQNAGPRPVRNVFVPPAAAAAEALTDTGLRPIGRIPPNER